MCKGRIKVGRVCGRAARDAPMAKVAWLVLHWWCPQNILITIIMIIGLMMMTKY